MTPGELEKLPKPLERTMTALEMEIMNEVVERIKNAGEITPVINWRLSRLYDIGVSKKAMRDYLLKSLKIADMQIDEIYKKAIYSDYVVHKELFQAAGQDYKPYEKNHWLQQTEAAIRQQTKETLRAMENITQTTGFNIVVNGKKVFTPLSEYLERSLDKAIMGIATGAKTYSQAIQDTINEMTNSGLRVVNYASGKSDRIEVAARRAVMTGVAQLTNKINEKNAKELGTSYWEVDWHSGSRPSHQEWQGKVWSFAEMVSVCGLGTITGFAGINCNHIGYPFLMGISKRKYTDEWLKEQNQKENTKKEYNGKEYTTYEALQYQRRLERTMRKQKQDIQLLEQGNADNTEITAARSRYRLTSRTYTEFSKEMGLRQQRERLTIPKAMG